MTNQPAANEPAAPEPTERDTASDNTEHAAPRYEADYLPGDLPPDDTEDTVTEPAPSFAEYDAEPPYAEKTPEPEEAAAPPPPPPPPPPPGPMPPPPGFVPPGYQPPGYHQPSFDRQRLVRPVNGRYVAGVCAAIGRATNTDPTLWRVLFAVLTLAGGVGLLGYLVGWLLIPAEGDSASPVESLLGRGQSRTSTPLVIGIVALAVLTFAVIVSNNLTPAIIGVAVVVGTAVLLIRGSQNQGQRPPATGPSTYPGMPPGPPFPGAPMSNAPTTPAPPVTVPPGPPVPPEPTPTLTMPSSGAPAMEPPVTVPPMPPAPPFGPLPPSPGGYRPPFAPHGPYASSSPYAASLGYPTAPAVPPYPGLQAVPAKPPKPPRPKSKLGRLTLSVLCLALGALAVVDIGSGVTIKPQVYVGTALAVIALGLILGAWLGRARWLIPIGVILTIALAATATVDRVDNIRQVDNIDAAPATVADIQSVYRTEVGDVNLDLSNVQFGTEKVSIDVEVGVGGNVTITLPPKVDTNLVADVQGGDLDLFGQRFSGLNQHKQLSNLGDDGAGGGNVDLTVNVAWGNVEVNR